jgi:hypothetical protein
MSMTNRLNRIRLSHPIQGLPLGQETSPAQAIQGAVSPRDRAKTPEAAEVTDHWLATQRKPLEQVEPIWALRWLLRKYFQWRGFACRSHVCNNQDGKHGAGRTVDCSECGASVVVLCDGRCYASIEYRGTFEDESDGRWAANCNGGEVKPIPFKAALPEETVSYGVGDVPQSEASQFYRQGVRLPFVAVPRKELDDRLLLEAKIEQVARAASAA